jgi:tRNA(adenine34) deaminase
MIMFFKNNDDISFMKKALNQAKAAYRKEEVPVGAVVVYDDKIISKAFNLRNTKQDPSAHAEFIALLKAAKRLKTWRLTDCTVYVTLEPCLMCAGLMYQARIQRCVYGAPDPKGGALGSLYQINQDTRLNHTFEVTGGILAEESGALLSRFFKERRRR